MLIVFKHFLSNFYIFFDILISMKKGFGLLFGSLFLFNQAVSQIDFSKDSEVKVVYNNEIYIVEQYKQESKGRAYKIHLMDASTLKKSEFIGDAKNEFQIYQDVALAANLSLDRWNEISRLEKIRVKFSQTNIYYQINSSINPVLEEVIKFAKEIYPEKEFSQEKLSEKLEEKYDKKINAKTLEIITKLRNANKEGKLKNDHDIIELVNDIFFDPSVNEIGKIGKEIKRLKSKLKRANEKVIDFSEMFSIRDEMYDLLRRGYSINAMQQGYMKATGDLLSRMETAGTILLGDDKEMNALIERTNKEITQYVAKTLSLFDILMKLEEEKFNPANKNFLAYKFLKWIKENEINIFSLENLRVESDFPNQVESYLRNNAFGLSVTGRNMELSEFKPNQIKITFPQDFKKLDSPAVSFDIMPLVNHLIDYYVIIGCEGEKGYPLKSNFVGNGKNKTKWKIMFDKRNNKVIFEESKDGKNSAQKIINLNDLSCWKIRIMPVTYYNTREDKEADINLEISNLEVRVN